MCLSVVSVGDVCVFVGNVSVGASIGNVCVCASVRSGGNVCVCGKCLCVSGRSDCLVRRAPTPKSLSGGLRYLLQSSSAFVPWDCDPCVCVFQTRKHFLS